MLSTRVKAALVFVPLVLILIYIGGIPFNGFITLLLLATGLEYARLFSRINQNPSNHIILLPGILIFALQRWCFPGQYLDIVLTVVILLAAVTALVQYEKGLNHAAQSFTALVAGILYIGWVGSFFISLREMPYGRGWLLTSLPSVWLADCGAYFIGRWIGKKKMTPRLSPGKTWAGLIGAVLTGMASGPLLVWLWRSIHWLPPQTPLWQGALMGLVLAILTPIGDLLISLFKRTAGVKDTGNLIPGHGGILDRIDTWIWAAMLGYYLVALFTYR